MLRDALKMDELLTRCLLYTSDAADDLLCVDLGGRRINKKKKKKKNTTKPDKQQASHHRKTETYTMPTSTWDDTKHQRVHTQQHTTTASTD